MSKVPDFRAFRNRRWRTFVAPILITALSIAGIAGLGAPHPGYAAPVAKSCEETDYNGDGSTDFCDQVLFNSYLRTGDPLGDLFEDGVVDLIDATIFSGCLCDDPPEVCQPSAGTIGVYFDPEGTIKYKTGVDQFEQIDLYVVAHGIPITDTIGGFTFGLDGIGALMGVNTTLPDGFYGGLDISTGNCSVGTVSTAVNDDCLTSGGTIVLLHVHAYYMGGNNVSISLRGIDHCSAPSEHPSYVSCISAASPSVWHCFDPSSLSSAVINPPSCVVADFNGDGLVDFCDQTLFQYYLVHGDPRGDLNGDGTVNPSDITILSSCLCTEPPAPCLPSACTIGVYFDAAGTITQLDGVPAFSLVNFYVVAHFDPGYPVGGFTFGLDHEGTLLGLSTTPPAGFMNVTPSGTDNFGAGTVSTAADDDCFTQGGTIVLMSCRAVFTGESDVTLSLRGVDRCVAPSEHPSFASCISAASPSVWNYFDPCSLGTAVINPSPCWRTDLNHDGITDFCDWFLLKSYELTHDVRGDFNGDGFVSWQDLQYMGDCVCSGPAAACSQGPATLGVYFDQAGTIDQLSGVEEGDFIDFYLVAHGVPEFDTIGGFNFGLEYLYQEIGYAFLPTGFYPYDLGTTAFGAGRASTPGDDHCLTQGGTIVLVHFRGYFPGGNDVTITPIGADDCSCPSEFPSYVSCISDCGPSQWRYFDPSSLGTAVINPTDFNCNGIADASEPTRTRSYRIAGKSDGTDWSMGIRYPGTPGCEYTKICDNALPAGSPPDMFVSAFVDWLNTLSPSLHAETGAFPKRFRVTAPVGSGEFEIGVSSECGPPWCWVERGRVCSFNPTIEEVDEPTDVPERLEFGVTCYPNPFNPRTTIAFDLPEAAKVELAVYDTAGRLVRTLISGRDFSEGHYEQNWDGRDRSGNEVAAGLYVYRLMAGGRHESGRMILLK